MYTIAKRFSFSASHVLAGLPEGHPCGRLHGHNYEVELILESEGLDQHGFVLDYRDLDQVKQWIDKNLDHRHLNDIFGGQPSAENLARWLHSVAANYCQSCLVATRVSETPKTWAEWRPEPLS